MRFFRAALVSVLLFLTSAAAAPLVPVLTLRMEPIYLSDSGSFSATASLSGATSNVNGALQFRRYGNPACTGSYDSIGWVGVYGNKEYASPNLQSGALGDFGLTVFFSSANSSANTDQLSSCVQYRRLQRTSVELTMAKTRFQTPARLEPQVTLTGISDGSPVELERFTSGACSGSAKTSTGTATDETIGTHSIRAHYAGTETLAESFSACISYTVGTAIRGRVFQDIDNNGAFDEGETGIAGVEIVLRKGQSNVDTTSTAPDGTYEFVVTSAGDYTIVQTQPGRYDSTTPNELTVNVTGPALADKNFGETAAEASPSRVASTQVQTSPPPQSAADSGGGFAVIQIVAITLVLIAVVALIVLLFAARARRGDEG